jgi:hypothetical protein
MTTNDNTKVAKSCLEYCCDFCNYVTSRKSSIDKHNSTSKHINKVYSTTNNNENVAKSCNISHYLCNNCDKKFNDRAGLWRHKKKCNQPNNTNSIIIDSNNDICI